jgi:hypothetical protein
LIRGIVIKHNPITCAARHSCRCTTITKNETPGREPLLLL